MKRFFLTIVVLALCVGAYFQETGGSVDALPKDLQPYERRVQDSYTRWCGKVSAKFRPLTDGLTLGQKWGRSNTLETAPRGAQSPATSSPRLASNAMSMGSGTVERILPDDLNGSRHQKFILRLSTGQTLLVAHNIDTAQRIPSLKVGDTVSFCGEYESNPQGGVIHWTHKDPQGRHVAGWLKHMGKTYQ